MDWFFRKTEKQYNPDTQKVEDIKGKAFGAFGATHNYSGSISMSTRIYGMFNFGKHRRLQAIRHVVSPSISASFSPEKGTHFNGYRTLTYVDKDGNTKTQEYNIWAGNIGSIPGKGKTASLSFSLGNNFEAKVRDIRDTTGTGSKKIKLIDNLSLSTGYNFLAEKFKMSNLNVNMSTSVLGKVGINASAQFDPYAMEVDKQKKTVARVDKFAITQGQGLARLNNASISLNYSISGDGKINGNDGTKQSGQTPADHYTRIYYHPITGEYIPGGYLYYMNPNAPWSLSFNYNFRYTRNYQYTNEEMTKVHNYTQTLGLNASLKLTQSFAMQFTTSFDLMALQMTATQITATYDLHCFNINVSWVPNGMYEHWSFRIQANAAALADLLKFKKSSSYMDNGSW